MVVINIEYGDKTSCGVDGDCYYILRLYPDLLPCAGEDAFVDECYHSGFFGIVVVRGG